MEPLGGKRRRGRRSCRSRQQGQRYKYEIRTRHGALLLKSDPYGAAFELPPATASIICRPEHEWQDDEWMRTRAASDSWFDRPMATYEVHLGSWAQDSGGGGPLSHLRRDRPAADSVRQGDGLHPHRAAAGDGAPVLGFLGLPGHRFLRADQPLRAAAGFQGIRRRVPPARHRRDPRLGAWTFSQGCLRAGASSTAPPCTSTPIRGRESIATGAR